MQISTEIEQRDLERLFDLVNRSNSSGRFWSVMYWWALALLAIMVAVRTIDGGIGPSSITWFVLLLAWLFLGRRFSQWLLRRIISRDLNNQDISAHLGSQTLELNDDGIGYSDATGNGLISWSTIKRVDTDDEHTFIFVSDVSALIVPHRCVSQQALKSFTLAVRKRAAA